MEENLIKKIKVSHAINLYKSGASLVDVGGESTRPGSKEVNENREWIELIRF